MTKTLAILAASLAFASALADGFVVSTNPPSAEQREKLSALSVRLEARGLPMPPAGAKWCEVPFDYSRPCRHVRHFADIYPGSSMEGDLGWLMSEGADGTNEYMFADGYRHRVSASKICPARLSRDVALLVNRLERAAKAKAKSAAESARSVGDVEGEFHSARIRGRYGEDADSDVSGKSPCVALLFSVELFRAGREDEAFVVLEAVEALGDLKDVEEEANTALARSDVAMARDMLAETGDFAAVASFLEKSLARNPGETTDADDKNGAEKLPSYVLKAIPQDDDRREIFLGAMRRRLDGIPSISGLTESEQKLAADLADWRGWERPDLNRYILGTIPWLIPAAWTNDATIPDNAATRIARLGTRAFPLIMAMQGDETPARLPPEQFNHAALFLTRGVVALNLRDMLLPFNIGSIRIKGGDEAVWEIVRHEILDASQDDLLLIYLGKRDNALSSQPLLWAHLAQRLETDFPELEAELLMAVTNRLADWGFASFSPVLTGPEALQMADLLFAVRGLAAVGFRTRLCDALRQMSTSYEFPRPQVRPVRGGGEVCVGYRSDDKEGFVKAMRVWTGKVADAFAAIELRDGSPEAIHARAETAADWVKTLAAWETETGKAASKSLSVYGDSGLPGQKPKPPEPPMPFVFLKPVGDDLVHSWPHGIYASCTTSSGKITEDEIKRFEEKLESKE